MHFFFNFLMLRWLSLSPATLEIHHQLQAFEALHGPMYMAQLKGGVFPNVSTIRYAPCMVRMSVPGSSLVHVTIRNSGFRAAFFAAYTSETP
jgi:hypothetical protein